MWWNMFGPVFASDIRRQRVSRMRGFRHWRWHLDEMYVKLNGEMVYLNAKRLPLLADQPAHHNTPPASQFSCRSCRQWADRGAPLSLAMPAADLIALPWRLTENALRPVC